MFQVPERAVPPGGEACPSCHQYPRARKPRALEHAGQDAALDILHVQGACFFIIVIYLFYC